MKNYPKIYNNDIKVLGRVVSIATENKVAAAEQVFDEKFDYLNLDSYSWDNIDLTQAGMDQYTINRLLGKKLKKFDDNIKFDEDGWVIELKVRNLIANNIETDDLTVNNNAEIKNLHITNRLTIKGLNIEDLERRVVELENWRSNAERTLTDHENRITHLEECCEEVRAIIDNLPTGAGDASFTVSPKSVDLAPGETAQITVNKGGDLTGTVRFTSNNTNIATVSASGVITAVADGTTTITVSVDGFRPTQDVTVKVTTPTPTYRVTFNPNNGQPSFYQDKLEGEKLVAVTDPVKEGYTFNGWHVNSDTGTVWNFNDPVTSTMMLIAGYTQNEVPKYTLTYKDGNTTLSTQQYEAGQAITPIADPTKSGYTFNDWNPSVPATMPANDLTVTAQWTEVIVPETHVYTLEVDPTSTTITAGNTATITATPKDNGTPMSGQTITWSSSNTSAATVSNGVVTAITEGTATITATWTSPDGNKTATCAVTVTAEPTYTLTFDTAGGSAIAARTYKAGATIEAVTPPTKDGYNFTGWTPAIPATMPAENLTVVAQWTEVPHEYNLTISPASMSLTVGQTTGNVITATCTDNGNVVTNPDPAVTWTSSVSSVATVSGGTVNPIAAGTTVITATWNGKQKTCSVTVSEPQPEAIMYIRSNMANHILLSDGTNTYTDDNEYNQSVRQSDLPRTFTVSTDDQRWGYNIKVYGETWPNGSDSEPVSVDITNSCVNGNTITISNFIADGRTHIVIELVDLNPEIFVTYKTNIPDALYINYGAAGSTPTDRRLTFDDFTTPNSLVTTDGVCNFPISIGGDEAATFFTVPDYKITNISVEWEGEEPAWLSDSGHNPSASVIVIDGPTENYSTPSYNGSFHVMEGIKSSGTVTITVAEIPDARAVFVVNDGNVTVKDAYTLDASQIGNTNGTSSGSTVSFNDNDPADVSHKQVEGGWNMPNNEAWSIDVNVPLGKKLVASVYEHGSNNGFGQTWYDIGNSLTVEYEGDGWYIITVNATGGNPMVVCLNTIDGVEDEYTMSYTGSGVHSTGSSSHNALFGLGSSSMTSHRIPAGDNVIWTFSADNGYQIDDMEVTGDGIDTSHTAFNESTATVSITGLSSDVTIAFTTSQI